MSSVKLDLCTTMNKLFWTALALAAASACCLEFEHIDEKDFELKFGKHYTNPDAEEAAAEALEESENEINAQNEKYLNGESSFYEKLNENSDMPKSELEKEREGAVLPPQAVARGLGALLPPDHEQETSEEWEQSYRLLSRQTLPAAYNATSVNLVTAVKNQGGCGSCACFAATSVHETAMLKAGAAFSGMDLSEQYLLDCGYNTSDSRYGCNGADSGAYGKYFVSKQGGQSAHEYTYPYKGKGSTYVCPSVAKWSTGKAVTSALPDYACTESKLQSMIYTYGSAVSYLNASDGGFGNYAAGVFNGCTQQSINHAITVVGWGTDATAGNYWIIKNSWGVGWGDRGFMKIKRGVNMCGIGRFCYAAQASAGPTVAAAAPALPAAINCDFNQVYGALTGTYYFYFQGQTLVSCTSGMCKPYSGTYTNACFSLCGLINCSALR